MKDSSSDPFAELDELLGEPTLLRHDDHERYRALQKKVKQLMKPRDLYEALNARDFVSAVWEGARFQSQASELINTQWRKALKELASRKSGFVSKKAAKSIEAYLALPDNKMTQNQMTESRMLREIGLSGAAIEAHSVLLAKDSLLIMDKLASNRNAARDSLLKEYRKQRAAKEKRLAAKEKRIAAKAKRKAAKAFKPADRANDNRRAERFTKKKFDAWA